MTRHAARLQSSAILRWALLAAVVAPPSSLHAQQVDVWDGNWYYTLSPYAWLPSIDATMRFQVPGGTIVNHSNGDIWDTLSGAFEWIGTARKGRWGVYVDFDWVDSSDMEGRSTAFGRQGAVANFGSRWDLQGAMANVAGLFNLGHGRAGYADLLFGVRYAWIEGALDWDLSALPGDGNSELARSGHHGWHADFVNPVVGVKGRWLPFHGQFFVPYHADVAGDGSTSSAQASVGVGYAFHWGDVALLTPRRVRIRASTGIRAAL